MRLLIHTCCANCSIYPVQRLRSRVIDFTGLWFNPNIHPLDEYNLRLSSLKRLSEEWRFPVMYNDIYEPGPFLKQILGHCMEDLEGDNTAVQDISELLKPESLSSSTTLSVLEMSPYGKRCRYCYKIRLEETAKIAKDNGFDAFSTTLLVSPYQGFNLIVKTGKELAEKYNIEFFFEDFRPGYREALKISREMGLYRQKYCGCIFSRLERGRAQRGVAPQRIK